MAWLASAMWQVFGGAMITFARENGYWQPEDTRAICAAMQPKDAARNAACLYNGAW